jgi:hypothetical protein
MASKQVRYLPRFHVGTNLQPFASKMALKLSPGGTETMLYSFTGEGWRGLPPHLMEWMTRQRFNGHAGDDTPGTFDA